MESCELGILIDLFESVIAKTVHQKLKKEPFRTLFGFCNISVSKR